MQWTIVLSNEIKACFHTHTHTHTKKTIFLKISGSQLTLFNNDDVPITEQDIRSEYSLAVIESNDASAKDMDHVSKSVPTT